MRLVSIPLGQDSVRHERSMNLGHHTKKLGYVLVLRRRVPHCFMFLSLLDGNSHCTLANWSLDLGAPIDTERGFPVRGMSCIPCMKKRRKFSILEIESSLDLLFTYIYPLDRSIITLWLEELQLDSIACSSCACTILARPLNVEEALKVVHMHHGTCGCQ